MKRRTIRLPLGRNKTEYSYLIQNSEGDYLSIDSDDVERFYSKFATVISSGTEPLELAKKHNSKVIVLEEKITSIDIDMLDPNVVDTFSTDLSIEEQIENLPEHVLKVEYDVKEE